MRPLCAAPTLNYDFIYELPFSLSTISGILVIGGSSLQGGTQFSVEFWEAEEGSCKFNDYPRDMTEGPTVSLVFDRIVACYMESCDIYEAGTWQHFQNTIVTRKYHSSVATKHGVLLIGGEEDHTTEWIPMDGSPAKRCKNSP